MQLQSNNSKNYTFWVGTEAELIKLFPIMIEMDKNNIKYDILSTGQNNILESTLIKVISLNTKIHILSKGPSKKSTLSLLMWFLNTTIVSLFKLERVKQHILIIHGDTISTLMGAFVGFFKSYKIAHVEAGLRSFNYLKPFPEEICRVIASQFVTLHFCPNDKAIQNLEKNKGLKFNTQVNTLFDSLSYFRDLKQSKNLIHFEKYFVFVIHRQENLFDANFVINVVNLILEKSKQIPCVFILHEPTKVLLQKLNVLDNVLNSENIMTLPRIPYFDFMSVLQKAEFLITDGGSNQEESYYMGLPCLILRTETERNEGLGHNAFLAGKDINRISTFFSDHVNFRKENLTTSETPSSIILKSLEKIK